METTRVAVGGLVLDVEGTYEDVRAQLARRTLTEEDGVREVRTTEGLATINATAVTAIVQTEERQERRIGFR